MILFLMVPGAYLNGIHPFTPMLVYDLENLKGGSLLWSVILEIQHPPEVNFTWGNKLLIQRR